MQVVRISAEHHFLTTLEKLKAKPKDWLAQYFAFSKYINHQDLIADPAKIPNYLADVAEKSEVFLQMVSAQMKDFPEVVLYIFPDQDIVALVRFESDDQKEQMKKIYKSLAASVPPQFSDSGLLSAEIYNYQKLADQKLVTARRFAAYQTMSDMNKVRSIPVRRARREHPLVMLVEDDRFTASYTSNILSKDYDLVVCRTGEEAIEAYIEHAPDIVFLDIHLPGLSGHEVLQAVQAVDPRCYVVMLSVDTAHKNIKMAAETGAQNFLKKPFSKERLLNIVRNSPYVRHHFMGDASIV
jgi:CheY-like chemotaxis protein